MMGFGRRNLGMEMGVIWLYKRYEEVYMYICECVYVLVYKCIFCVYMYVVYVEVLVFLVREGI